MEVSAPVASVKGMPAAAAAAFGSPFLAKVWRNRENLGRSWNCRRFVTEAPPNLRAIHAAEHTFRERHGHFTTDLVVLGFSPNDGEVPSTVYAYGFGTPYEGPLAEGEDPSRLSDIRLKAQGFATGARLEGTASKDAFTAMALTEIFPEFGLDAWTIDEHGRVRHVQDGCWN